MMISKKQNQTKTPVLINLSIQETLTRDLAGASFWAKCWDKKSEAPATGLRKHHRGGGSRKEERRKELM